MEIENARFADLTVKRLTEPYIDRLAALSDACVGEGMYPPSALRDTLDDGNQHVYMALDPAGELAAYIYFRLIGVREAAAAAKVSEESFAALSRKAEPVIAQICSIGVADRYRGQGVSGWLCALAIGYIDANGLADAAFGTAWKVGGKVVMDSNLLHQGFRYLQDAHMLWYDHPTLNCPVCHGRCRCDAAVYVRTFGKEARDL